MENMAGNICRRDVGAVTSSAVCQGRVLSQAYLTFVIKMKGARKVLSNTEIYPEFGLATRRKTECKRDIKGEK